MSLTNHRWLWLLATALAAVSLAATTALASEPDEDDEDDGEVPAQILPATPLPASPAAPPAASTPPAASSPVLAAPVTRGEHRTTRPESGREHTTRQSPTAGRVAVRPVARVSRTSRQRTRGFAVHTVPRGGVQAGAGGLALRSGSSSRSAR